MRQSELAGMALRLEDNMRRRWWLNSSDEWRLAVEVGSKKYGVAYRVVVLMSDLRFEPFGTFHFGFTARECYDRMHAMCVALEHVR